jgi:hypothetical protein
MHDDQGVVFPTTATATAATAAATSTAITPASIVVVVVVVVTIVVVVIFVQHVYHESRAADSPHLLLLVCCEGKRALDALGVPSGVREANVDAGEALQKVRVVHPKSAVVNPRWAVQGISSTSTTATASATATTLVSRLLLLLLLLLLAHAVCEKELRPFS